MARLPLWLKAVLLAIPGLLLVVGFVFVAVGWYVKGQMQGSGGVLPTSMAAYDVRRYALDVVVDPERERIRGSNRIGVEAVADSRIFEIHLDDRLDVHRVLVDDEPAAVDHREGVISVELAEPWRSGSRHQVRIDYEGKPKKALKAPWIDGFVWSRTPSGEPWIGVTGEGDGGDNWWPCKDHPSDEPDEGMEISLTVPAGLVGLSNGRRLGESANDDGTVTTHWRVSTPINNYGVTLNIGPYIPIETTYQGVHGNLDETLVFWSLPGSIDDAERLWRQLPGVLEIFGRRFGEYPFLADKLWAAHAPYLGMEHQTLIAYGGDFTDTEYGFDWLLAHELAHEWWGNKITASDWADFWLHEGFASYSEALLVLDTLGEERYLDYMHELGRRMTNREPLVKGSDLTTIEAYSPDIYGKGAWVLHMLRFLLGEERFSEVLWRFADGDNPGACRFASTGEFVELVEEIAGRDLDWFWRRYLFAAGLPAWRMNRRGEEISINWDDPAFEMPLPVRVGSEMQLIQMVGGRAELIVVPGADVTVDPYREVLADTR